MPSRHLAPLAPALLVLAACSLGRGARPDAAARPVDVEAPDLAGRSVRVAEESGRVRVVDFWATWCEPCREQLVELERLARQGDQAPVVYAVSVDEDRASLDAFLAAWRPGVRLLWDQGGRRHAEPLDLQQLPTTLVVDRAGLVRHVHRGWRPEDGPLIRLEVARLLAEPAPAPPR